MSYDMQNNFQLHFVYGAMNVDNLVMQKLLKWMIGMLWYECRDNSSHVWVVFSIHEGKKGKNQREYYV